MIEFSAPDTSLTVPQVEHAEKDSKSDSDGSGPPINHKILDAAETPYTVVVYTPPKRRDSRASDSAYSDNEDNGIDEYGNPDPDHPVARRRDVTPTVRAFTPRKKTRMLPAS